MATAFVTGNVAMMIQYLRKEGIAYTPALLMKIIQNSATKLIDFSIFEQGYGKFDLINAITYINYYNNTLQNPQI